MVVIENMPQARIEDLCINVTSGGTPSRKNPDFYTGDIPWLKTGELKGWFVYDAVEKITEEAIKKSSAKIYPKNTVLMAMYGDGRTIGSVAITAIDAASNQASCAMVANQDKCLPLFLFYSLKYHRETIVNLALGGAQRNLNQGTIKNFEINCPPLPQQKRIVDTLSNYDNLIENNNRRIAILEDMAQSLYREWFVNFRYPNHEDNLDADGNPKLTDSPLGQIPEGWEVKRLDDYVTLQRGFDLPKAKRNNEGGVPIYAASGLTGYHDEIKAKGPGIVTGRSGTLGIVKLVLEDHWPLNTSLWVKKFENCTAHYAYYLLDSIGLERFNSGASVPTLNRNDVHGSPVIAPPLALINKFEEIVAVKHNQINVLKRKNENLKQQRDMLLPKLISGTIEL
ncbi:restriction endonuclease subunit S [Paraglaciecola chathamensis]|uniref:Type I restriction enzyme, S subunit n=1 Tax=Paraglaciecola chathamensis S18K6 TaxID=1127672 RepID=A0AAV3UT10_9ALTE|nr:restriction endonuclease subunit S [Paraglaciecola chathamensis]GAC08254.1 type I restriction enzyme, S subunit [Paraglaciecola chathamensis S18K6]